MVVCHGCAVESWRVCLLPLVRVALCIYFHDAIGASMFHNYLHKFLPFSICPSYLIILGFFKITTIDVRAYILNGLFYKLGYKTFEIRSILRMFAN